MGKRSVNILLSSVGRRVELVRAFRQAYTSLGLDGCIIGTDVDPLAPALQVVDKVYLVPRLNEPEYIPTLEALCVQEQISLLFPLIDPEIPVLAKHRDRLEATGAHLAVVPEAAAEISSDKWLTYQFFRRIGMRTPQSWLVDQVPADVQFPLFIKPRRGSASAYTFKLRNAQELQFFSGYVPAPIIQSYLSGPEITNDVICDVNGDVLGVVSRQRIQVRSGEVMKGVTVFDQTIADACVQIAKALPAIGPITVQCMLHEGVPYFTEINARMGGGLPLGIAAGADSPRWLLARAAEIACDIPAIGQQYATGLHLSRFDDSFFITGEQHDEIASRRIRSG